MTASDTPDQDTTAPTTEPRAIVGLGASAGGVQAYRTFFEQMPSNTGLAFVCILHLSPDHESRLAEIIGYSTQMPVTQITQRMRVEPNHIYVIAPNEKLELSDGHLIVSEFEQPLERFAPIDVFLRTLARGYGNRAIACILSGTGANGSVGIKQIKESGGVVLAQEPQDAEYDGMPRNAIATGLVDIVVPVAEMPARILQYDQHAQKVQVGLPAPDDERPGDDETALHTIFTILRVRTGHDFSNYKRSSVLRRIERRMHVHGIETIILYSGFLRDHPEEAQALLKDLLISVTNFFRDQPAFEVLEREVLPRLFAGKTEGDQVRIWVAGCATGEEAYSIAMLAYEQSAGIIGGPSLQIFATDIDEHAISVARNGFYTDTAIADLTPERLRRFFVKEQHGYRVCKELRERVMFAHHNLLKDPPFSHLDLVSCRNLLIYLNRRAQEFVMGAFHFALRPNGYLFLGSSESLDGSATDFIMTDREHRIFRNRSMQQAKLPVPDLVAISARAALPRTQSALAPASTRISYGELHLQLLEQYAPPSVVVNETYDILHLSEHAGRFLEHTGGEPTHNLLRMIRPELRLDLHTALLQAQQQQHSIEVEEILLHSNGATEYVNIIVQPSHSSRSEAHGLLLVIFKPVRPDENGSHHVQASAPAAEPATHQFEEELERVRDQLRVTIEQYQTSVEEFRASNEELQALNEELRATTEELETSKEELQSVNEELSTVNQELKNNIDELNHANSDLRNLMNATHIATVFLDRRLRIKLFTPSATSIFNLLATDTNRPLAHITHKLKYDQLLDIAGQVLDNLHTRELEIETTDGGWHLLRVLPYRTAEDRIDGVVMTFTDITARKRAEDHLLALIAQAEAGISESDLNGHLTFVNECLSDMLGYTREELLRMRVQEIMYPSDLPRYHEQIKQLVDGGSGFEIELRYLCKDGTERWVHKSVSAIRDAGGQPQTIVAVTINIAERKESEATQAHFRQLFESAPGLYLVLEPEAYRVTAVSDAYLQATMTERADILGMHIFDVFPDEPNVSDPQAVRNLQASFERVKSNRRADVMAAQQYAVRRPDGKFEARWWSMLNSPVFGAAGEIAYLIHRVEDVTAFIEQMQVEGREPEGLQQLESRAQQMEAEIVLRAQELLRANQQLHESQDIVRLATDAAQITTWNLDLATQHIEWSSNLARTLGFAEETLVQDLDALVCDGVCGPA